MLYVLLLVLLAEVERRQPDAAIRSFWDALWYALATMTTVGYGDVVPRSIPGRIIGYGFMLLSIGVWAAVISTVAALLRGRMLPKIRLWSVRKRPWFVFSEKNDAALALAADLQKQGLRGMIVFCGAAGPMENGRIAAPQDAVQLLRSRLGAAGKRTVFVTGADEWQNAALAQALQPCGVSCYCRGKAKPDMAGVSFFDPAVLCARRYWQEQPLGRGDKCVLICGDGPLAQAILEQALIVCCRQPFERTELHLFGDWTDYQRRHPELCAAWSRPREDALVFHSEPWDAGRALLERADRILFCGEDPIENARGAADLREAFPLRGAVHAAADLLAPCGVRFGAPETLYTVDLVMHRTLDRLAKELHQIYAAQAEEEQPAWDDLSPFLQDSNRASADHLMTRLRLLLPEKDVRRVDREICREAFARYESLPPEEKERCLRNGHARWMRFHILRNWRYAPERDRERRLHPCLTPFDSLSFADKAKDGYAWEQIGQLAKEELP